MRGCRLSQPVQNSAGKSLIWEKPTLLGKTEEEEVKAKPTYTWGQHKQSPPLLGLTSPSSSRLPLHKE